MKKQVFLILCVLFTSAALFSQELEAESKKDKKPLTLVLYSGYFGELISHPGLIAGADVTLFSSGKTDIAAGLQTGYYYHRLNSHGLFIQPLIRVQRTFSSGFFLDAALGAGYLHMIPDGKVYEVVDGKAAEVSNCGSPNFMPSFSLGAGYKFWQKTSIPLAVSLSTGIFGEYPFNTYMLPRVFVSLSCLYRL